MQNYPFSFHVPGLPSRISEVTKTGSQKNVSCQNSETVKKLLGKIYIEVINVRELSQRTHTFKKITSYIFRVMLEKSAVLEVLENVQKNVFSGVPFEQLELPNLQPVTVLKTGKAANVSYNF